MADILEKLQARFADALLRSKLDREQVTVEIKAEQSIRSLYCPA